MASTTFNTRIQCKYDTLQNWNENNPKLLLGEIAITSIPSASGDITQAPAIVLKVGDGEKVYSELPFVKAVAADVYSWAKAASKPTYDATEITGIDSYIADYVNDQMGISVDTDTQYQIVKVDDYNYKLQSKGKTDSAWADVSSFTIPKYDDTTIKQDIANLKTTVGNKADTSTVTAISDRVTTTEGEIDALQETIQGLTGAMHFKGGFDELPSASDYEDGDVVIVDKKEYVAYDGAWIELGDEGSYITKTEVTQTYETKADATQKLTDAKNFAISEAEAKASAVRAVAEIDATSKANQALTDAKAYTDEQLEAASSSAADKYEMKGTAQTLIDSLNVNAVSAGIGQVISSVSESKGKVTATLKTLTADDIPTLTTTKIDGLAAVATSGNIKDLTQTNGDYIIFNCGTSSTVID